MFCDRFVSLLSGSSFYIDLIHGSGIMGLLVCVVNTVPNFLYSCQVLFIGSMEFHSQDIVMESSSPHASTARSLFSSLVPSR